MLRVTCVTAASVDDARVPVTWSRTAAAPGSMIRSAHATLLPDGVSSTDTSTGTPLTLVVIELVHSALPPVVAAHPWISRELFWFRDTDTRLMPVPDGIRMLASSPPPVNVLVMLSPAAATDSANRTTTSVGVAAEETFAVTRAALNWGSASDPGKDVPSAANDGVPVNVAAAPAPMPVTNTVEPEPSSMGQEVAGTLTPVSCPV